MSSRQPSHSGTRCLGSHVWNERHHGDSLPPPAGRGRLSGTLLQDSEPSVITVIILHVCKFDLVDSVSLGLVWNHFPAISQLKVIFMDNNGLFEAVS